MFLKQQLEASLKEQGFGSLSAHRRSTLESGITGGNSGQRSLHSAAVRRVGPGSEPDAGPQQASHIYTASSGRMLRWWPFDWLLGKKRDRDQQGSTSSSSNASAAPAAVNNATAAPTNQSTPDTQPAVLLSSGLLNNASAGPQPGPDDKLENQASPVSFAPSLALRSAVQCVVTKLLADPKAHFTCAHDKQASVGAPQVCF